MTCRYWHWLLTYTGWSLQTWTSGWNWINWCTYTYSLSFKRSLFCSPMLHLFDQEYSKKCVILLEFKISVFYVNMLNCNLFLWSKLYFQHHYSSLQCHMIFRNHNNMLICCSRNISDYYQCWKQLCCTIFLWKLIRFIFQDSQMNRKFKRTLLIQNRNLWTL